MMIKFRKRVKEVAELLENKDKCIDILKEQIEVYLFRIRF